MRIALQGASGSGKTYSALRLAFGLTRNDNIAIVDTENGSAHLYSSLGNYQVLQLTAPFTPERYIEAIDVCMILLYKLDFSQLETKLRYYGQDYQRNSSIALQENGIELRRDVWK